MSTHFAHYNSTSLLTPHFTHAAYPHSCLPPTTILSMICLLKQHAVKRKYFGLFLNDLILFALAQCRARYIDPFSISRVWRRCSSLAHSVSRVYQGVLYEHSLIVRRVGDEKCMCDRLCWNVPALGEFQLLSASFLLPTLIERANRIAGGHRLSNSN